MEGPSLPHLGPDLGPGTLVSVGFEKRCWHADPTSRPRGGRGRGGEETPFERVFVFTWVGKSCMTDAEHRNVMKSDSFLAYRWLPQEFRKKTNESIKISVPSATSSPLLCRSPAKGAFPYLHFTNLPE